MVLYHAEASELNLPSPYLVGHYQLSLDMKNEILATKPTCKKYNCAGDCIIAEPRMNRLIQRENRVKMMRMENRYIIRGGGKTVEQLNYVKATITFMIGNLNTTNLFISHAKCKINILGSFSCDGCNTRPYFSYQSTSIDTEGVMPITTNCSFETNVISCGENINTLTNLNGDNYCTIVMPTTNQTINVNFNYTFVGQIDNELYLVSEDFSTQAKDILSNYSFWKGVVGSFGTLSIVVIVSVSVIKLVRICMIKYAYNEVEKT